MSESKAKKIEIKDVDGLTLSKLIDYIYTAEIEVTEENVQVRRTWWWPPPWGTSSRPPCLFLIRGWKTFYFGRHFMNCFNNSECNLVQVSLEFSVVYSHVIWYRFVASFM